MKSLVARLHRRGTAAMASHETMKAAAPAT